MTASVFQSVLCPTDFSEASIPTFAHALRIAIGSRSELHLLNVARYAALDHAPLPLSTTPCTTTPHRVARKTRLAAFLALFGPVSRPSKPSECPTSHYPWR